MAGTWKDSLWLALDLETTGLDPGQDLIVELAAVSYQAGEVVARRGMLLNPGRPIPAESTAIHGITDAMVADKPRLSEVAPAFLAHVRATDVLIGYNWPFDAGMLAAELGDDWASAIAGKPIIDVLVLVRSDDVGRYWPGKGRHKLEAVARRFGLEDLPGKAHQATADAVMTCRILRRLLKHLPDDAEEAAALLKKRREQQDDQFRRWQARQPPRQEGARP